MLTGGIQDTKLYLYKRANICLKSFDHAALQSTFACINRTLYPLDTSYFHTGHFIVVYGVLPYGGGGGGGGNCCKSRTLIPYVHTYICTLGTVRGYVPCVRTWVPSGKCRGKCRRDGSL